MLTINKPPSYAVDSPAVFHLSQDPAWDHERIEAEIEQLEVAAVCRFYQCEPAELEDILAMADIEGLEGVRDVKAKARDTHPVRRWLKGETRFVANATLDLPGELAGERPTAVTIGTYLQGTPTGFAIRPVPHVQALRLNKLVQEDWDGSGWVAYAVRWGLVDLTHVDGDFKVTRGPDGALDDATIDGLDRISGLLFELALAILNLTNRRHDPREGKR